MSKLLVGLNGILREPFIYGSAGGNLSQGGIDMVQKGDVLQGRCPLCGKPLEIARQPHAEKLNCPHCLAAFTIWDLQLDDEHVSETAEDKTTAQDSLSEKTVIQCPNKDCRQGIRLPKVDGVLHVKCPKCGTSFAHPTETTTDTCKAWKDRAKPWLVDRARGHPLFLGLLATAWSAYVVSRLQLGTLGFGGVLIAAVLGLAVLFGVWLLGVWILDIPREEGVPWYYRKWFTLLMLVTFTPLGIILLWAGSRFKRPTKVALTMISGLLFVLGVIAENTATYRYSLKDEVADLVSRRKGDMFLKPASSEAKAQLLSEMRSRVDSRGSQRLTPQEIYEGWGSAIVEVTAKDKDGSVRGQGSGFIIGKHGAIATNYHVVETAHAVSIQVIDEEPYERISLVCASPLRDIAVLQIEEAGELFFPVTLGDSDTVQVGERIVAIGNPLGLQKTVTTGDVSALRDVEGQQLLQISAPISPGSSGGALFNLEGEVVGITTVASFWKAQNLNFAVPINSLKSLIGEASREQWAEGQ